MKKFPARLFHIVWDDLRKMNQCTQHHVLPVTNLQPAKVSFQLFCSHFTNTMQFQEQEYLDENIYHHKYLVQHCNCTMTHQAAEPKTKTKQLHILQARKSVRIKHLVRSREVIYKQRKFHHPRRNWDSILD